MRFYRDLKLIGWIASIVIACAFLTAPAAQAAHSEQEQSSACGMHHDGVPETIVEQTSEETHEHHAHGCGSCHLHADRAVECAGRLSPPEALLVRRTHRERMVSAPRDGPYRPPSA